MGSMAPGPHWTAHGRHDIIRPLPVDGLMFYHGFFLSFFFFRRLISEVDERNSTKIAQVLRSNCDLKMHVQNLGHLLPLRIGGPKRPIWTTSQLNGKFNGLYLRNKMRHRQSVKCFTTTRGSLHCLKISWTLVRKWLQSGPPFLLPNVNSAFYVIARLRRRRSANRTQTNLCQTADGKSR